VLKIASTNSRAERRPRTVDSLPIQPVPDHGAYEAEDVSNRGRNHDEHNRRRRIEWSDEVHRLDHVRPENEIEDRLRRPMRTRSDQITCQPAINGAITSPTLLGLVTLAVRY
jgi:hypothetical protein